MAILWAANSDVACPEKLGTTVYAPYSTMYRADYVRTAIRILGVGSYLRTAVVSAQADVWFSAQTVLSGTSSVPLVSFLNGGTTVFQIRSAPPGQGLPGISLSWGIYQGGVTRASALVNPVTYENSQTPKKLDIHYLCSASGYVRLYEFGRLNPCVEFSGDTSSWGSIDQIQLHSGDMTPTGSNTEGCFYSELILATEDTRRMCVKDLYPVGNGASAAWSGSFADVDEAILNVADYVASDTAGQEVSYTLPDLPTGRFVVKQVRFSAVAAKGNTGPSQLQLGVRIGGTNYFGSAQALEPTWDVRNQVWDVQPSDSQEWTVANINALEIALKSVT
jgi:hypothetical protein